MKYFLGFKFRWGFSIATVDHISITSERVRYSGVDNFGSRWAAEEPEVDAALVAEHHPKLNTYSLMENELAQELRNHVRSK